MAEPGEPTDQQKLEADANYLVWCALRQLDPDDQRVAREFEEWWEETNPPGEEQRW